jgi:hypothetical protein
MIPLVRGASSTMSAIPFPVVSFKPFLTGSEDEQRHVAQELYDAFHTFGWIYLKDFGISQEEVEEMFAMVRRGKPDILARALTFPRARGTSRDPLRLR